LSGFVCHVTEVVKMTIDASLMLEKKRSYNFGVDQAGSIGRNRKKAVYQENTLGQPIKWKPVEKNIREELNNTEACENNPISEPFRVICCFWRFKGLH